MQNRNAYVSPGKAGCGMANRAINPTADMVNGPTTKGHLVLYLSAILEKM